MIECRPNGICSWNFTLEGESHQAQAEFDWIGECGRLLVDGTAFQVNKEGLFSGLWQMNGPQGTVLHAAKESAFRRRFAIGGDHGSALLRAESAFGRSMRLEAAGTVCTIQPVHPFTRRAEIHGATEDFRLTAFAFWLTAVLWRRAANNNSGAGS